MTSSQTFAPRFVQTVIKTGGRSLLVLLVGLSMQLSAEAAIVGKYSIMVGESARYLKALYDYNMGDITETKLNQIKHEESCKNPAIRMFDKNQPAFLVRNTSDQDNELSSVIIDMQQAGYVFGLGDPTRDFSGEVYLKSPQTSPGVTISGTYDGSTKKLKIDFSGLGKDEMALFRIDLDPDPNHNPMVSELYPDYRSVLLGADPGTGPTDPATVSVAFTMTGMDDVQTEPMELQGPDTINHAGELEVYHAQTPSDVYGTDGEIPEPSSVVLLGLAGLGLAARRR